MAKAKATRKEMLKKPDEFITLSARIVSFAREHSRQFGYAGIALAAVILIYLGITTYFKYINEKGQEAYNTAYYTVVKNMGSNVKEEDLQKAEELFNEVIEKYGISKAARLAMPELAYTNFLQKNYDEAITGYEKFLDEVSEEPYVSLARMALAACYEEKGEFEKALETLDLIRTGPDDFFKEQAMLSLARVYRLTNNSDKSNEVLKEFIENFKTSPFLPLAKAYLSS